MRVGAPLELRGVLTVGPHGIAEGGALVLIASAFWGWTPPQAVDPDAPGYTRLEAPEGVRLRPEGRGGQLWARVEGRALAPGETVRVLYGEGGSARADRFAERSPALWLGVDADGDGVRGLVPEPLRVTVEPGPAAGVVATLPSVGAPGEPAALTLALVDAVGNGFLRERAALELDADPALGLPETVHLEPAQEGHVTLTARPAKPGVYRVQVAGLGPVVQSNPLVVREGAVPVRWADLQFHSGLSDGTGTPSAVWRYARHVAALDVAALTDHDHFGMRFLDAAPELRADLDAAVAEAHAPGVFVALHGYEYTHWLYGHRHVLYFDGPGPVYSAYAPETRTPNRLWEALRGRRVFTVPHHVAGGPVAISGRFVPPPGLEPVWEIVSVHGQSEAPEVPGRIHRPQPGAFALDRLREGRRFAFVGSTDAHDGHPGLSQLAGLGSGGGLAALVGAELTRRGVYEALKAGHTYATNGSRIVLRTEIGGRAFGTREADEPVSLEVRVIGTAPVDRVELVQRAGVVGSRHPGQELVHVRWEAVPSTAEGDFAYVRVIQTDGGIAWSSPVFFD